MEDQEEKKEEWRRMRIKPEGAGAEKHKGVIKVENLEGENKW